MGEKELGGEREKERENRRREGIRTRQTHDETQLVVALIAGEFVIIKLNDHSHLNI